MSGQLIESLKRSLALVLEREECYRYTALRIQRLLESEGAMYPVATTLPTPDTRPGAELDAALAEANRTAARKAKEPETKKPVKAPNIEARTCESCGRLYTPRRKDQRFCSKACSKTGQALTKAIREEKPCGMGGLCVICGKEFAKAHPTQKACSPECVAEKNRRYAAEKYAKAHPGSTARAKDPAAANKAPAPAPAPVSRVDRIKAAAARVDGMPQSVLAAAAEAAASEAFK